jgi:hypothetical protein
MGIRVEEIVPIRFRKTIKLAPGVRLNMGKNGMSLSVGAKGAKLNFSKKGVRETVGVPGTGISQSDYIVKNETESKKDDDDREKKSRNTNHKKSKSSGEKSEIVNEEQDEREFGCFPWGCLLFVLGIAVGAYFVASAFRVLPANLYISNILLAITEWLKSLGL